MSQKKAKRVYSEVTKELYAVISGLETQRSVRGENRSANDLGTPALAAAPLPRGKGGSRIALPRTSTGLAGNTAQLASGQERAENKSSDVSSQPFRFAESMGFKGDFNQREHTLRIGN